MPPEKPHWVDLYQEVVTSGLCTGCAACIVVCPHDVLHYNDGDGVYRPWKVDADGGPTDCTHGAKGCTMCTRACPRVRTSDPDVRDNGQDGGLVSAILIWALEHEVIDAALVSALEGDGTSWKAVPAVARTRDEVLATAGSRYTYSANTLAYLEAVEGGAEKIALVGMSCQASAPAMMKSRKAGKVAHG